MRLNFSDFAPFIVVARHKSFRAAGDELGLSPSAISHAIKQLEQRLKIRLFNRTTRSVALTEAGKSLYDRMRPAFDEINTMIDEVNCFRDLPMGTLKINAARVAAKLFLIPLVVGFSRQYPDIKVEITTDDKLADIVGEAFDAGVRPSAIVEKDMIAIPIGPPVKFVVVATPDYFTQHGKPTHPRELVDHQSVIFRFPSGRPHHWEFYGPEGKLELAPNGNIILDDVDAMLDATLLGAGIAFLYYDQVKSHLESGQLVSVLDEWLPEQPGFQLYYPSRQYMTCGLRAFVDYIKSS
ncbi:LysR family transcriptional regulator [Hafnia alvei]|uniref:LysR family transcriptional regulator n=1 Tax=Hafnia alvei TaxID=569 RepID=UPI0024A8D286|nr:LysR family transcriptional regulator [Hafnia alvei]